MLDSIIRIYETFSSRSSIDARFQLVWLPVDVKLEPIDYQLHRSRRLEFVPNRFAEPGTSRGSEHFYCL